MPQKHQSTKTHQAMIICIEHFSEILWFSDLVARLTFCSGLAELKLRCAIFHFYTIWLTTNYSLLKSNNLKND